MGWSGSLRKGLIPKPYPGHWTAEPGVRGSSEQETQPASTLLQLGPFSRRWVTWPPATQFATGLDLKERPGHTALVRVLPTPLNNDGSRRAHCLAWRRLQCFPSLRVGTHWTVSSIRGGLRAGHYLHGSPQDAALKIAEEAYAASGVLGSDEKTIRGE